jgi:DNA topoisomerase-2
MPPKSSTKKYQKMDPINHILARSDMYCGSTKSRTIEEYIAIKEEDSYRIFKDEIISSPALLRIFVEPLSNAIDNVERSKKAGIPCTKIKVSINIETGETSVWNNGDIIPIEFNDEQNCYNHSLIFGQLLTGSNYDDEEERVVSGRNGLGGKISNVFSSSFRVRAVDPENRKKLTQIWTNNMKETEGPNIEESSLKFGYTEITWTPDFSQFKLRGYSQDILNLYTRYVIDAAMLTKVDIYLNNQLVPVSNLTTYSRLYQSPTEETLFLKSGSTEVLLTPSTEFQAISFVNGVYTRLGGQHVDAWSEAIFRPLVNKFNKKGKPQLNIKDIKQFFRLFVISTVINPEFDSQEKNRLESPAISGVTVSARNINEICSWSIIANIEDIIRAKEMVVLKKAERKKKGFVKIEGLDPANNAGGKYSTDCTLILCEGLSAKTYAVAGIEKGVYGRSGRDWFGVYPLRGKVLNVRNSAPTVIAKNAVITDLIQALGIRHGVDYTVDLNYKQLSYGKIMIMTDSDVDGIHIEGLLMNFFHALFPTVYERSESFIVSMKTPIVRVFRPRGGDLLFYDERKFREYASSQTKNFKKKYYKGLGTTKPEDVPDTFGLKMVEFVNDEDTYTNMNKVFHKRFSDDRKQWLGNFNPKPEFSLDDEGELVVMSMSNFLNREMIKFSHDDCKRSIPNGIDGLKESQRKILYAMKKRKLRYSGTSLKVAQLGGYVAEHTNYHHGEQNLFETITKMANEFPGTNNIPLLYRDGMFGSRLSGGKDSASPRYIYTKMDMLTHLLFREEDDVLLDHVIDDGDTVEPKFYVPIIPMILSNGCSAGIGTGWSCNVPCYNPLDIIAGIKIWLENDGEVFLEDPDDGSELSLFPEMTPWYRGFEGVIEPNGPNRFITYGILETDRNKVTITELPIGMWTDKFKETCEEWVEEKSLKSMKNYSTPKKVNFVLTECPNGFRCSINSLKLHSYLYTSNMVLFTEEEKLNKYNTVDEILNSFCIVRYKFYIKRKQHMINALESEVRYLGNKERFVTEVTSKTFNIMNVEEDNVIQILEERGYDKDNTKTNVEGEDVSIKTGQVGGYDYLLRMQVRTFTANKIRQLQNDIYSANEKLDGLRAVSEKQMWLNDLNEFERAYMDFLKIIDNLKKKGKKKV